MTTAGLLTLRARLEPTRANVAAPVAQQRDPVRRPARVAQMLALAHRIDSEITSGVVADRAEAAARLGLTAARVSQLCDLLVLAPDIQEQILFLESVDGVEPLTERALRPLVKEPQWEVQRGMFLRRTGAAPVISSRRDEAEADQEGGTEGRKATAPACASSGGVPRRRSRRA